MLNMETTAWDELQKESRRKEQEVGHQLRRCDCARPDNEQASTLYRSLGAYRPPPPTDCYPLDSQPAKRMYTKVRRSTAGLGASDTPTVDISSVIIRL